ncbi:MAG: DUF2914 domain-containing protein, partial [Patescibacteria group bacterium]
FLYENFVFIWGLLQIALVIILLNAYDAGRLRGKIFDKIIPFLPIFMQFSFGNLFSGFIVFYIRSGSILISWPFLLILGALFLGNEFFRKRYLHLSFQTGVFFIALFSYSVFVTPVLLNEMGASIFLLSGAVSLLILGAVLFLQFLIMPAKIKFNLKPILVSVGTIYLVFQILYFGNIIPPAPLSVKDSGIYHSIERVNNGNYFYRVGFEPAPAYLFFEEQSGTFHKMRGDFVYSYSAIFSPADLDVTILHKWSYFDETKGDWTEIARIPLNIIGGRDKGYRGYSYIINPAAGKWRVDIITGRGQVLGRRNFNVVEVESSPDIETEFR